MHTQGIKSVRSVSESVSYRPYASPSYEASSHVKTMRIPAKKIKSNSPFLKGIFSYCVGHLEINDSHNPSPALTKLL